MGKAMVISAVIGALVLAARGPYLYRSYPGGSLEIVSLRVVFAAPAVLATETSPDSRWAIRTAVLRAMPVVQSSDGIPSGALAASQTVVDRCRATPTRSKERGRCRGSPVSIGSSGMHCSLSLASRLRVRDRW